jgi:hypothetical protein
MVKGQPQQKVHKTPFISTMSCHPKLYGRLKPGGWQFQAKLEQNSSQDPISEKKKLGMVVHACHPSYRGKGKIGLWPRLAWAKSKIKKKEKQTGNNKMMNS